VLKSIPKYLTGNNIHQSKQHKQHPSPHSFHEIRHNKSTNQRSSQFRAHSHNREHSPQIMAGSGRMRQQQIGKVTMQNTSYRIATVLEFGHSTLYIMDASLQVR